MIALSLLDLLPHLTSLFSVVYVPEAVLAEATSDPYKPGASKIAAALELGYLKRCQVSLAKPYSELIDLLDLGEAEALSLAKELGAVALVDERRGRRVAAQYGIPVVGTAALLIQTKKSASLMPLGHC